ncbi:uncharacterized protein [Epargyreus clarus]|uniref:uncharacterized protein n=1 Tax=Epargyreus clarus TaxID=520877 RepID=UPI003C2C5846
MSLKGEPADKSDKMTLNFLTKFIRPYNGDRDTLPAFLTNCENAMSLASADQQVILCKYIISQLEGKAQIACSLKTFSTWQDLKHFLKTNFGEKKHSSHLLIDLQNCRQSPSESVSQFSLRLETCLTRIQADIHYSCSDRSQLAGRIAAMEDLALNTFLLGLNPNISTIVRCKNPSSLNEAINSAVEEEKIYKLTRITQRPSKHCSLCNKQGHLSSDCYRNHHKSYHMPNPAIPNSFPNNINSNKFCNYCKNKGHMITECRKREFNNRRRVTEFKSQPEPGQSTQNSNVNSNAANNAINYCAENDTYYGYNYNNEDGNLN